MGEEELAEVIQIRNTLELDVGGFLTRIQCLNFCLPQGLEQRSHLFVYAQTGLDGHLLVVGPKVRLAFLTPDIVTTVWVSSFGDEVMLTGHHES